MARRVDIIMAKPASEISAVETLFGACLFDCVSIEFVEVEALNKASRSYRSTAATCLAASDGSPALRAARVIVHLEEAFRPVTQSRRIYAVRRFEICVGDPRDVGVWL